MRLVITAPAADIDKAKNELIQHVIIASLCIAAISVILTLIMTGKSFSR